MKDWFLIVIDCNSMKKIKRAKWPLTLKYLCMVTENEPKVCVNVSNGKYGDQNQLTLVDPDGLLLYPSRVTRVRVGFHWKCFTTAVTYSHYDLLRPFSRHYRESSGQLMGYIDRPNQKDLKGSKKDPPKHLLIFLS